jgi:hypothetical protein
VKVEWTGAISNAVESLFASWAGSGLEVPTERATQKTIEAAQMSRAVMAGISSKVDEGVL